MTAAALRNVSKSFKGLDIFTDASIEIEHGRITGIQGPNGSGKSVLFKMLCGFVRPDSGEVYLDPQFRENGDDFPSSVGIIIDRPGYLPGLTGIQNLQELAKIRRVATHADIVAAMERVGLPPATRQRVRNYSLGMKQKLAIAQSFMEGQRLLLLDEAFNGLDTTSVKNIRSLLTELRDEGRTVVITSHNQADIDAVCDDVWLLDAQQLHRQ